MNHQERVAVWLDQVFDAEERANTKERSLRVVEEAIELAQACGADEATVHRLVEYIFERPVGEPAKELAGVMVTVYAAAESLGESADARFDEEMHRIWRPEVRDRVRRRQVEKRARLLAYDGPPQTTVYCDHGDKCPGHASPDARPCGYVSEKNPHDEKKCEACAQGRR